MEKPEWEDWVCRQKEPLPVSEHVTWIWRMLMVMEINETQPKKKQTRTKDGAGEGNKHEIICACMRNHLFSARKQSWSDLCNVERQHWSLPPLPWPHLPPTLRLARACKPVCCPCLCSDRNSGRGVDSGIEGDNTSGGIWSNWQQAAVAEQSHCGELGLSSRSTHLAFSG